MKKLRQLGEVLWVASRKSNKGQTLVEYGLIVTLVAMTVLVSLTFLSDEIEDAFDKTVSAIVAATGS
jgi:Flp pilus assembly pilin Flp